MKHILLFGAGKSATFLIHYLEELAASCNYKVTIADGNLENVRSKTGDHPLVKAVQANVENEEERKFLVEQADVVISLLPPALHYLIALDCLQYEKHLLTASYIDGNISMLRQKVEDKKLLFLCEMGLDPGIDHMSAMSLIHRIKALGGRITSFKSHCGGLVAPESDDNPWHYKISWNPKNVIEAGKSGAVFKELGIERKITYEQLFTSGKLVKIDTNLSLAYYPNRDSLAYIPVYQLDEADTFIRTTLRHPDFCFGWKNIIDLKLTDETVDYNTNEMTMADFFKLHFNKYGFNKWLTDMLTTRLSFAKDIMENLVQLTETETQAADTKTFMEVNQAGELNTFTIESVKRQAATLLAEKMHEANLSLMQLFFLGLDSDENINMGMCSAAQVLQVIMERKLSLQNDDKDMVVMLHEIEYELNGIINKVNSSLIVKGEDSVHTAMAKTVGLPLGIAAKLILDGSLTATGVQIPILSSIYNPVLKELEKHGIVFKETLNL